MIVEQNCTYRIIDGMSIVQDHMQEIIGQRCKTGFYLTISLGMQVDRIIFLPDGTSITTDEVVVVGGFVGTTSIECRILMLRKEPLKNLTGVLLLT
jgi:hypothetical protein